MQPSRFGVNKRVIQFVFYRFGGSFVISPLIGFGRVPVCSSWTNLPTGWLKFIINLVNIQSGQMIITLQHGFP